MLGAVSLANLELAGGGTLTTGPGAGTFSALAGNSSPQSTTGTVAPKATSQ